MYRVYLLVILFMVKLFVRWIVFVVNSYFRRRYGNGESQTVSNSSQRDGSGLRKTESTT